MGNMNIAEQTGYFGIFSKLRSLGLCGDGEGDLYGPYFADFYNQFIGDHTDDIPVFTQLAPQADMKVLDLASGAARIGIALGRLGYEVDGIELSQDMIALARKNLESESPDVGARLHFEQGDICRFANGRKYDLIILGVTSISLLLSEEQRRAMFDCVAAHLKPGARFVFDTIDPEGPNWQRYVSMSDVWSCETERGTDFSIVGQQLSADGKNIVFNVYREQVGWDGETTRSIGNSTKAWLPRDVVHAELASSRLQLVDEFARHDMRYYVTQAK